MEKEYRSVPVDTRGTRGGTQWTPFWKQLHMSSGVWTVYFMNGLCTGAPTVFVPQIRRDWNTTRVDDEMASWFYSASNLTALPWVFFLPALSQLLGRKTPYLACCLAMSVVNALLYFSSAPYQILIAQSIQGFVNASAITMIFHIIPEYCSHKYRSTYLSIQSTSFYWGMWASNAIGSFCNWKYISVLGLICSLYSFTLSFYPESPRWLASKGKVSECESTFRWLRGTDAESEKELRDLIKSQTDYQEGDNKMSVAKFVRTLRRKEFYMPLLLSILVGAQYNLSGKFVCSIYALDIIKKISRNKDAAYTGMLVLDGVTVFGMYVGSVLSKVLKSRTLLLRLSCVSIAVMFALSLYLYLAKLGIVAENNIVTLGLLVCYSLAISSGPIIVSLTIYSEIISIKYQAVSYMITSFVFLMSCTGMLKFSPILFKELGVHGTFMFYGVSSGICTLLLFVYLPETKNKTLVEIEQCFKDSSECINPEVEKLNKPVRSIIIH